MGKRVTVVTTIKHPRLPGKVEVKLEEGSTYFHANFQGQRFNGASVEALQREIFARMETMTDLDWVPVLSLYLSSEGSAYGRMTSLQEGGLFVKVDRFYLAATRDITGDGKTDATRGGWTGILKAPWEVKGNRLQRAASFYGFGYGRAGRELLQPDGTFALPWRDGARGDTQRSTFLRYTEEAWAGILAIIRNIHEARRSLDALTGDTANVGILEAFGQAVLAGTAAPMLALPAPKSAETAPAKPRKARKATPAKARSRVRILSVETEGAAAVADATAAVLDMIGAAHESAAEGAPTDGDPEGPEGPEGPEDPGDAHRDAVDYRIDEAEA